MFALGLSSKKRLGPSPRNNDEQWYIPYNGPYEAPPPPQIRKARDSWGDPIDDYAVGPVAGDFDVEVEGTGKGGNSGIGRRGDIHAAERRNSAVKDPHGAEDEDEAERNELYKRYGGGHDEFQYGSHGVFDGDGIVRGSKGKRGGKPSRGLANPFGDGEEERERGRSLSRGRDRAFSVVSTTSSGALDPGRSSFSSSVVAYPPVFGQRQSQRRSTVSSSHPQVIPSYISLNGMSTGGVGESPMPQQGRHGRRPSSKDSTRKSLASIFTFGAKMKSGSPARSIDGGRDGPREREKHSAPTPSKWTSSQKTTPSKTERSYVHEYARQVDRPSPSRRDSNSTSSAPTPPPGAAGPSRPYSPFGTTAPAASGVIPQGTTTTTPFANAAATTMPGNYASPRKAKNGVNSGSNHDSLTTDDEDYYNSYYSMLERGPGDEVVHPYLSGVRHGHSPSQSQEVNRTKPPSRQTSTSPNAAGHPYAYQYPQQTFTSQQRLDSSDIEESSQTNLSFTPSPPPPPSSAPPLSGLAFSSKHPYSTLYTHHPYGSCSVPVSAPLSTPHPVHGDKPIFTVPSYSVTQPSDTTNPSTPHPYAILERAPSPSNPKGVGSVGLNLGLASLGAFGRKLRNSTSTPNLRLSKHVQVVSPTPTSVSGSSGGSSTGLGNIGSSNTFVNGNNLSPQQRQHRVPVVQVSQTQQRPGSATPSTVKSKDRWLSAETWCDALLFPRPRLKVRSPPESSPSPPGDITVYSPQAPSPGSAVDVGVRLRSPNADPFAAHSMGALTSSSMVGLPPTPGQGSSGRIVSSPGSPLWPDEVPNSDNAIAGPSNPRSKPREPGIASRVLAHSRSLVDLHTQAYPSVLPRGVAVESSNKSSKAKGKEKETEKSERPKSFALDDLDLPTPVPSLAHVLAEGQQLEEDRQAWQAMATKSFGNKRARSLSRTRAKSMTRKGRATIMTKSNSTNGALSTTAAATVAQQSHIEYLAAQACLGNQNIAVTPNVEPPKLSFLVPVTSADTSHATGTTTIVGSSRLGHSHSNSHATSVAKTITNKSSRSAGVNRTQTHSRSNSKTQSASGTHSRGDSWSKHAAVRVAKICGNPSVDFDMDYVGVDSGGSGGIGTERIGGGYGADDDKAVLLSGNRNGLENALRGDGTRIIKLADPAHMPIDKGIPVSHSLPPPIVVSTSPSQHPYNHYQRKTPSPAFSTTSSGISESKVGIAIGTPPSEEALQMATKGTEPVSYSMSHPYAQGFTYSQSNGASTGAPSRPTTADRHAEFAGPHPTVITPSTTALVEGTSSSQAPPISAILARHKLAPHLNLAMHPYAKGSSGGRNNAEETVPARRDSYLDANGLVGQYRSDDRKPHPSKMWAQLSPGVVREVLEGDLQYSPILPVGTPEAAGADDYIAAGVRDREADVEPIPTRIGPLQGWERERMMSLSIHDTAGVAEALVNASRYRLSQDPLPNSKQDVEASERNIRRPATLAELPKLSDPNSNHTIASSRLDSSSLDASHLDASPEQHDNLSQITSGTGSTSPRLRPLGSPNDLDSFQDLFYRPSTRQERRTPGEPALPETPSPATGSIAWDTAMKDRRTGSGLTSLARQLSEDMEALALENGRASSFYAPSHTSSLSYSHSRSQSMGSISHRGPIPMSRRPTEGSLQFVFEEMASGMSPASSVNLDVVNAVHVYHPSGALPEDVQSSRASSMIEGVDPDEEEEPTSHVRLGMVESLATPPVSSSERRFSYNGETVMDSQETNDDENGNDDTITANTTHVDSSLRQDFTDAPVHQRALLLEMPSRPSMRTHNAHTSSPRTRVRVLSNSSVSHPHDAVRASYMTATSDASRMSGLSDFPVPPPISAVTPQHVSYLASYFDDEFKSGDKSTNSLYLRPPLPLPSAATLGTDRSSLTPSFALMSGNQTPQSQHPDVEFGDNQSAAELAKTLSSPSPHP